MTQAAQRVLGIQHVLSAEDYFAMPIQALQCPTCGDLYQHSEQPYSIDSRDKAGTIWEGRGDVLAVPIWGECGLQWLLCLGFHKGYTGIFVRLVLSCDEAECCGIPPGPWSRVLKDA